MDNNCNMKWLEWAKELQFLAQVGLTYTKDDFDKERYERIRAIAAEMMSLQSGLPLRKGFCDDSKHAVREVHGNFLDQLSLFLRYLHKNIDNV